MFRYLLFVALAVSVLHTEALPGGKGGGGGGGKGGGGGGKGGGGGGKGGGGKGKGLHGAWNRQASSVGILPARDADLGVYGTSAVSQNYHYGHAAPAIQYRAYRRELNPYEDVFETPSIRVHGSGGYFRDNHLENPRRTQFYDDDYISPLVYQYPYGYAGSHNKLYLTD